MTNKKRAAAMIGAIALTAVVAIGGTLAYLTSKTDELKNTFSSSKTITTKINESFDPEEASKYTPGQVISKVPTVTNTSESEAVWAAVSVQYTNGASSMTQEQFKQYATITWGDNFADTWTLIGTAADGTELYMCKTTIAAGATSPSIFTEVTVNSGITEVKKTGTSGTIIYTKDADGNLIDVKDNTVLVDDTQYFDSTGANITDLVTAQGLANTLPSFNINVCGFAVQSSNVTETVAVSELKALAASSLGTAFN